jgi:hypothetical protein
MNCPSCQAPGAYVGFTSVACPNESCSNYDPSQVPSTQSGGEIEEVEDEDEELWGLTPEWRVFVQKALGKSS